LCGEENMKTKLITICLVVTLLLMSCQTATPTLATIPSPAGQAETQAAATLSAKQAATIAADITNQTATAKARKSVFSSVLTADALTAAAVTPVPMFNVQVPASACWMNSEVNVLAGHMVKISASGMVNTYGGKDGSNSDPNGQANGMCGGTKCPVIGVGYGSLIGRVGGGKAFFVGSSLEFVPDRDGPLYFTVNDWECDDNSGTFDLVITLK
jgi:hypothetical protein